VVNGLAPYERRIGMVFQNYALWPHMTVADNIGYGLRLQRLPGEEVAARLREGLRKVNLAGFEARYPGQLSGGQQQRVALARALVLNPDILLLDEPLSNLDAKIRVQVRAEIRRLQRELAITTIYVTHDQEEALSLSDRVAVMRDGRVLQVGPPRELYERPRTRFVADFVGTNNLVPGEVESRAAGGTDMVVRTALGPLRAIASGAVSARCVLAVRPENVALGSAAAGEGNRVAGRVSLVSYLGSTVRYDVETEAGLVLKADIRDAWHHDPLPVGRPVTLHFPPSVTLAVSDDA
jgi:ABC-type Fe3+/spermidine/putrescine transport system ATPase subunit